MKKNKKPIGPVRYVYNVETEVAQAASDEILKYLHKKSNDNLRLLPEGWKPGDPIVLGAVNNAASGELTEAQLAKMLENFKTLLPDLSEEAVAEKIFEATGQRPAISSSAADGKIAVPKETIDKILEVLPDAVGNDEAICQGGGDKGKPKLSWLREKTGLSDIGDQARDEAWDLFKEMM